MALAIVRKGSPVFLLKTASDEEGAGRTAELLLHSSLDTVDAVRWTNAAMDLKAMERFNERFISASITPSMDILVLHTSGLESKVPALAATLRELVTKACMNPLQSMEGYIDSAAFRAAVEGAASKALGWEF